MDGDFPLGEVTKAVDGLQRLFEEFKTENETRLAEIEKKGHADPLTEEKVNKLSEAIGEANGKVEQARKSLEGLQEKFDAEKTDLEQRIDMLETAARRTGHGGGDDEDTKAETKAALSFWQSKAEKDGVKKPLFEVTDEQVDQYRAYTAAFKHYIRYSTNQYGQDLPDDMRKALSTGIQADGGYWVIPEIADRILTRLFETSPIRSVASVVTIGTQSIELPNDTNDATLGGWVGEKDARAETATPQVGTQEIFVREQFANPRATQNLLDDAQFNVESWLANKIADKLMRTENTAFVSGDGIARPRGFTDYGSAATTDNDADRSWGVLQYVASGAAAGFAASDPGDQFIDLVHKLNPAYRTTAVWMMSRATLAEVRKFKDGQGNYLWSAGDFQNRQPQSLLGYPVVEAEDMPAVAANAYSVAYGSFREGYLVVDRQGVRTLRDPFSAKPFVQFYTTKRVGGDVVNFDAIKLMKIASS